MSAGAGEPKANSEDTARAESGGSSSPRAGQTASGTAHGARAVTAGRVGRAHGLDGSFYVTGARPRLLAAGATLTLGAHTAKILRRAGTDEHPIVRMAGIEDRLAAEALRGLELTVELAEAPALEEGEWWAQELEGCEVFDGERHVGTVVGLMELPSCEALEVRLIAPDADGQHKSVGSPEMQLLVPMVSDAVRQVDSERRRIDVNMAFLGED